MDAKKMLVLVLLSVVAVPHAMARSPEKDKRKSRALEVEHSVIVQSGRIGDLPRCALGARSATPGTESIAIKIGGELMQDDETVPTLTGNLYTDLLAQPSKPDRAQDLSGPADGRRSPALAFGMSAVVPGLGQVYNKSWIRAAVAGALEIGLWTGYFTWRGQGQDGEIAYQAFAHRDWSPYRYGTWLNQYPGYTGPDLDVDSISDVDFMNPTGWTADQEQRVLAFFEDLRAAERVSRYNNADGTGTGATFSHVLPNHGDQQYYELIGKYFQFGAGWSDWCAGRDPNDVSCFSIEGFNGRDEFAQKTALFFDYAADHADANSLLRRASRVTSIIVANHLLAGLDALLTARFHNRGLDLESSVSLRTGPDGSVSPVANLRMTF